LLQRRVRAVHLIHRHLLRVEKESNKFEQRPNKTKTQRHTWYCICICIGAGTACELNGAAW
jgi:hypothetical protein